MPIIYIHAGAPKTGTSYLQKIFAEMREALRSAGVFYPYGDGIEFGRDPEVTSGNGAGMAHFLHPSLETEHAACEDFLARFRDDLAEAGDSDALYSSEYIVFAGDRASAIAETAAELGFQPKLVFLVRDLKDSVFAAYSQRLKRGETGSFSDFMEAWSPGYQRRLAGAVELLGRENVLVFNFGEQKERLAKLFLNDILSSGLQAERDEVVNQSLSWTQAQYVREMNAVRPGDRIAARAIARNVLESFPAGEEFYLTDAEAEGLHSKFAAEIAFVNGLVRGRPISVGSTKHERIGVSLSASERALLLTIANLAGTVAYKERHSATLMKTLSETSAHVRNLVEMTHQMDGRLRQVENIRGASNSFARRAWRAMRRVTT